MSDVLIPLGGAGGKNRGEGVQVDEDYTYLKMGTLGVGIPLPAGNYKALKAAHGEETPFSSYGDGKNAAVFMTKEFLKKVTIDYFEIASITNFSLSMYAHRQVRLTWAKPSQGLWSGVRFIFKYGSMPTSETDGFMFYDSADVHYETAKLEERELFVRAFNYVTVKDGRWYDEGAVSARITVTGISGSVTLSTGAGVWTVPENVYKIRYILVGQGGEGCNNSGYSLGGAGGGGGYFKQGYMTVTPGQTIPWAVPTAMQGIVVNSKEWQDYYNVPNKHFPQLDTVFGNDRVSHGYIGWTDWSYGYSDECAEYGGNGGSGGGCGNLGAGGKNGSDGANGRKRVKDVNTKRYYKSEFGGTGSHQSTTGFNGVLYASGGDGGKENWGNVRVNGTDGLGNGGGGEGGWYRHIYGGGKGGTGCIYIAWGSLMNDGS